MQMRASGHSAPGILEDAMTRKHYALAGAAIGLVAFLAVALLPSLLYGGYAGVLLARGIFGAPIAATFWVRAMVVLGMVVGVTAVAALFAVAGAAAGAAVAALVKAPAVKAKPSAVEP